MNKQIFYVLKFYKIKGEDEQDIILTQTEGQRIIMSLLGQNVPKFVVVRGSLKAVSSIKSVDEDARFQIDPFPELTSDQQEINKRFLGFTGQKLLN